MNEKRKQKVYIGLSGGVDSAVSAALLKKTGYDVRGVYIKVWQPEWIQCNWAEERRDAMRVAAHLDIPFETLDLEEQYKKDVIDYMIAEYSRGRTPNPDVMCNKSVKFGGFYDYAMNEGADFVATGHYVRIARIDTNGAATYSSIGTHPLVPPLRRDSGLLLGLGLLTSASEMFLERNMSPRPTSSVGREGGFLRRNDLTENCDGNEKYRLLAGVDPNKDQSYFLWTLKQEQLPHILFPVGNMRKDEVRKLAKKFALPNATKKDSQGLCFIGKVNIKQFLSHYVETEKGNVLDRNGNVIGEHDGAIFYTIGERHGFRVKSVSDNDERLFVIDKDMDRNTITVAHKGEDKTNAITISNTNWIGESAPEGEKLEARSRYREQLKSISIKERSLTDFEIRYIDPVETPSSGQSLVVYDGEECLGGGIID
ncbi:MAG: tRNA 2-thiouridine(34) synthase MnmA [Patescibacteria group bacterium]|nr:tRNA 2-thiouridine(34) synthase MnmA [Patescibacteria group bacterium]